MYHVVKLQHLRTFYACAVIRPAATTRPHTGATITGQSLGGGERHLEGLKNITSVNFSLPGCHNVVNLRTESVTEKKLRHFTHGLD